MIILLEYSTMKSINNLQIVGIINGFQLNIKNNKCLII